MSFEEHIKDIVDRRLIKVDEEIKKAFPSTLNNKQIQWISFTEENVLALIFIDPSDLERIEKLQKSGFHPFPGLITTQKNVSAAFGLDMSRNNVISGCRVTNSYSFAIGSHTTFIILDHKQSIETKEIGNISYTVPLGYFVSSGKENKIERENTNDYLFDQLEELISYSIKTWRDSHGKS